MANLCWCNATLDLLTSLDGHPALSHQSRADGTVDPHAERKAATERGRSVVIVTHDARLKDIADRVLWLEDGSSGR